MNFEESIKLIGRGIEVLGIAMIVVAIVIVSVCNLQRAGIDPDQAYWQYRHGLGTLYFVRPGNPGCG